MLKDSYQKILKKLNLSKGADPSKAGVKPYRDWKILVISFFIGLTISIGLNLYMSVQIINNNFLAVPIPVNVGPVLNRDGLNTVLANLAEKEAFLTSPSTSTSAVVDPSR